MSTKNGSLMWSTSSSMSAKADDAVARALVAKRNPVFEAIRAEDRAESRAAGIAEGKAAGMAEGKAAGMAEAVIALLVARVSPDRRERDLIVGERDPARLERWITRAITCTSVAALLAEPRAWQPRRLRGHTGARNLRPT
jgi:hypothetical protein